jgi:hypothetical protein
MSRLLRLPVMTMIVFSLSMMLAACGTTALSNPTQSAPTGLQTISMADALGGTLTVQAPHDVLHRGDDQTGLLSIGTSEATMSTTDPSPVGAGQWGISISAFTPQVVQVLLPSGQPPTPQVLLDALKGQITQSVSQVTFGTSETTTIGGHNASRLVGSSPQGDIVIYVLDLTNSYLVGTGVTAVGELATRESQFMSILSSATYTPAS